MNTLAIVILILAIAAGGTLLVSYMVKRYILWEHERERAKIESTWKAERQQAELTLYQKEWRAAEQLADTADLFPVGNNTGVYSPYPVVMTEHEKYIFNAIAGRFGPHCIFADTYLSKRSDGIAQIDIIAICTAGIIVIESKGYKGWIFGDANDRKWMQVLSYGKEKYPFYNPIKQNASHIATLRNALCAHGAIVHSLIVFGNDAEIRGVSSVPENCYILTARRINDVLNKIFSAGEIIQDTEVIRLADRIRQVRIVPNNDIRSKHSQGIRDMLGSERIFQ